MAGSSRSRVAILIGLALLVSASAACAQDAAPKIRVLILSGKNNHDWQKTTPELVKMYEDSKRFVADVTNDPSACTAASLAPYDVIVSNWTNYPAEDRIWGEEAEKAILDFVRNGKGYALFHAANACFPAWPEYVELIGMRWLKGKSGHGAVHEFKVTIEDKEHPVTRGIEDFSITDELYHRLELQPHAHVLCKAFSAKDKGGTGNEEPMALTTSFGQGRCFNLILGHNVQVMQNQGWRKLMLRGTEWAATGKVTEEMTVVAAPVDVAATLQTIAGYTLYQSREPLFEVEHLVQRAGTDAELRGQLAAEMARMLGSDATPDSKAFLLQQLSLIGGPAEVPTIASLLGDEKLGFYALFALERIPDQSAAAALRGAVGKLTGLPLVGVINSLGEKRDAGAVETIAGCLTHNDPVVVEAAIAALGKIGGPAAAKALQQVEADVPEGCRLALLDALARCAQGLLGSGNKADAAAIFKRVSRPDTPPHIRAAALNGLVACAETVESRNALLGSLAQMEDIAALRTVLAWVADPAVGQTAAQSVVRMAEKLAATRRSEARAALQKVLSTTQSEQTRDQALQLLEALGGQSVTRIALGPNLAQGATATSPDDLDKDGAASGDQAAIDGNSDTYWDEVDGQALYRLRVTFKAPTDVSAIRIIGYQHHNYAPRDFEILCDDKPVKTIRDAQYEDNEFITTFPMTRCTTLELKITGYYGRSPAIRELEIYLPPAKP